MLRFSDRPSIQFVVVITPKELDIVSEFEARNNSSSKTEAVEGLLRLGMATFQDNLKEYKD